MIINPVTAKVREQDRYRLSQPSKLNFFTQPSNFDDGERRETVDQILANW